MGQIWYTRYIQPSTKDKKQKMQESAQIHEFEPSDRAYAGLAAVGASCPPQYMLDYEQREAGDWRAFDAGFAAEGRPAVRFVAEPPGRAIVGYAGAFEIGWAPPASRFWCQVRVLPEWRGQCIGARLYYTLLAALRARGAAALQIELDDSDAAIQPALERRGFRPLLKSWAFTLDVPGCDLVPLAGAYDRLGGLALGTLAGEIARGADWLPGLHALYLRVGGDVPIPISPHGAPSAEWLREQALELPDCFFVVRDGERYAGMSYLHRDAARPDRLLQRITAIDPDYRGRGIAQALKRATIEYAQRQHYREIRTAVESNNPSMLAINARVGFVQREGLTLFELSL